MTRRRIGASAAAVNAAAGRGSRIAASAAAAWRGTVGLARDCCCCLARDCCCCQADARELLGCCERSRRGRGEGSVHSPSRADPLELCARCCPGGGVSSRAESIHQHTSTPPPALGHLYGRGFKTSRVPEQGTLWARGGQEPFAARTNAERAIAASDSVAGHGRASLLRFLHPRSSRVRPPPRETAWRASTVRRRGLGFRV